LPGTILDMLEVVYNYYARHQASEMHSSKMRCQNAAGLQKRELCFRTLWLDVLRLRTVPKRHDLGSNSHLPIYYPISFILPRSELDSPEQECTRHRHHQRKTSDTIDTDQRNNLCDCGKAVPDPFNPVGDRIRESKGALSMPVESL